jgi:hypothetical protein
VARSGGQPLDDVLGAAVLLQEREKFEGGVREGSAKVSKLLIN